VEYKKTYHRNGKLFENTPYVNGKIQGIKLEYYDDGALRKETPYDSGYVHGNVKFYYPDGKVFSVTPRIKGNIHGIVKKYHKNGNLQSETPYINNELQPGLKEYNQRGVLLETPSIQFITKKEKRGQDMLVTLEMKLSNGIKSTKFFQGVEGADGNQTFVPVPTIEGVGQLTVILPKKSSIDVFVFIRAEFVTNLKNRCLVEEQFRLTASNY
jgi:hypothetical protein